MLVATTSASDMPELSARVNRREYGVSAHAFSYCCKNQNNKQNLQHTNRNMYEVICASVYDMCAFLSLSIQINRHCAENVEKKNVCSYERLYLLTDACWSRDTSAVKSKYKWRRGGVGGGGGGSKWGEREKIIQKRIVNTGECMTSEWFSCFCLS